MRGQSCQTPSPPAPLPRKAGGEGRRRRRGYRIMSRTYTEKVEEKPGREWQDVETAPSVLREDEPTTARWVGTIGAALGVFGGAVLAFNAWGWSTRVDA